MIKRYKLLFLLLGTSLLMNSCFIFRPKNKCDTCPHFGKKH
jgi:hypothetical protein